MRMALSYAVIIKGLGGGRMQGYQLPLLAAELLLMFFFSVQEMRHEDDLR